jgi:hypothetical protein
MIGSLMMCVSVVVLSIGMLAGIAMGITQNFVLAPAHAHLSRVGGVLLFLFGLHYRLGTRSRNDGLDQGAGLAPYRGRHPVSGRRSRPAAEGALRRSRPHCGLPDRGGRDAVVHGHRVPDGAGVNGSDLLSCGQDRAPLENQIKRTVEA